MPPFLYFIEMRRAAESHFKEWFDKQNRKPLIIRGARQVGKSTLVRQFAKSNNLTLYEVNLERHPELHVVFKTMDVNLIIREIEIIVHKGSVSDPNALLFIDEIQAIPDAIAALRYFYEEKPNLPVIAAGSLLEFTLASHSFSMPVGRIEYYYLGPMSFSEFLYANGNENLEKYISNCKSIADYSTVAHQNLSAQLRDYIFVGGMPEAVNDFTQNHNFKAVNEIHYSIINTYRDDFAKYADKNHLKYLQRVFDYVPSGIGRKMTYSQVNKEWKTKDIRNAVDLLAQAGVIHKIHHVSGAGVPLAATVNDSIYKPLFLDIGLVNTVLGAFPITMPQYESQKLVNEGPIAEQFIGQHLLYASGFHSKPAQYYWLREGKSENAEVDYLIQAERMVIPIEVKAGSSGTLRSLHQFCAAYSTPVAIRFDLNPPTIQKIEQTIPISSGNKKITYLLLSLPLYLVEQTQELVRNYLEM